MRGNRPGGHNRGGIEGTAFRRGKKTNKDRLGIPRSYGTQEVADWSVSQALFDKTLRLQRVAIFVAPGGLTRKKERRPTQAQIGWARKVISMYNAGATEPFPAEPPRISGRWWGNTYVTMRRRSLR